MFAVIVTSCKTKMTTQEFNNHQNKVFSDYCTNDVRAAEKTLLDDLQTLSKYESNHLEGTDFRIDFDAAKSLDHERLFLIYRKTHETNKMEFEFQQSLGCLARSNNKWRLPPPPSMTHDEFAQKIEKREHGANVRWKTNTDFENAH
ncbi:MAG: hypothetical protein ABSD77_02220 [Verrucomicrobiota bacterium]|jgi:hypothetical protein